MKTTCGNSTQIIVHTARQLRKRMTPAEKRLWEALRNRRLAGLKFRRQHPYSTFILDFYCPQYGLVVEVDGGIHEYAQQASQDAERTAYLNTQGIRVIRFRNEEISHGFPGVLRRISDAAFEMPHSS